MKHEAKYSLRLSVIACYVNRKIITKLIQKRKKDDIFPSEYEVLIS